jgi:hypothetical protein
MRSGTVGPDKYDDKAQHLRVRPAQEGAAIIDFALGADGHGRPAQQAPGGQQHGQADHVHAHHQGGLDDLESSHGKISINGAS